MAVSHAKFQGHEIVMCASTGNTSASAAAYAARGGMKCVVLIPDGNIALGKLAQALVHGAQVISIQGNFDDALTIVREVTMKYPIALVNSVNPVRIDGQKTAAFEIVDELGEAPDIHALPVGNAGNITAYWKGFKEYFAAGISTKLPRILGFQAEGAAPIVDGAPIANPKTVASAIRIGNPASWQSAVSARDESGGLIAKVSDTRIIQSYLQAARLEGVFAEPASLTPIAGLKMLAEQGYFQQPVTVTVTLTGNGLKDPGTAVEYSNSELQSIPPTVDAVIQSLGY